MGDHPDGRANIMAAARDQLIRGISSSVEHSIRRRTPFMSDAAVKELTEDVAENVMAFLRGAFDL